MCRSDRYKVHKLHLIVMIYLQWILAQIFFLYLLKDFCPLVMELSISLSFFFYFFLLIFLLSSSFSLDLYFCLSALSIHSIFCPFLFLYDPSLSISYTLSISSPFPKRNKKKTLRYNANWYDKSVNLHIYSVARYNCNECIFLRWIMRSYFMRVSMIVWQQSG